LGRQADDKGSHGSLRVVWTGCNDLTTTPARASSSPVMAAKSKSKSQAKVQAKAPGKVKGVKHEVVTRRNSREMVHVDVGLADAEQN
jgi:hypothetical protein